MSCLTCSLSPNLHAHVSQTICRTSPRADWGRGQGEGPKLESHPLILTFSPKFDAKSFFVFARSIPR